MLTIVGERINSSRKTITDAISQRNAEFIKKEGSLQKAAGAALLDVNCAFNTENEIGDMEWLIEILQSHTGLPLSLDSPNPDVIERGLKMHKGKALINSVTLENAKMERILPLAAEFKSMVIVLAMDERGVPENTEQRLKAAQKTLKKIGNFGIRNEDVFIDPLLRPISSEPKQANEAIESIKLIKAETGLKLICGLSNVSYGLPERSLLNGVALAVMMASGLDAAIMDPSNKRTGAILKAANALLGNDEFSMDYIASYRSGMLNT